MADKPKTYAQQVQELKDAIAQKDEQIAELLEKVSFITEMQDEIAHLRGVLEAKGDSDQRYVASNKAQLTDAIQRAESAEQGLRNAQAKIKELENLKQGLESQLDILGHERDKNRGKDDKIIQLQEALQFENMQVAKLTQRLRDLETAKDTTISGLFNQIREWKVVVQVKDRELSDLKSRIESFSFSKHLGI